MCFFLATYVTWSDLNPDPSNYARHMILSNFKSLWHRPDSWQCFTAERSCLAQRSDATAISNGLMDVHLKWGNWAAVGTGLSPGLHQHSAFFVTQSPSLRKRKPWISGNDPSKTFFKRKKKSLWRGFTCFTACFTTCFTYEPSLSLQSALPAPWGAWPRSHSNCPHHTAPRPEESPDAFWAPFNP